MKREGGGREDVKAVNMCISLSYLVIVVIYFTMKSAENMMLPTNITTLR